MKYFATWGLTFPLILFLTAYPTKPTAREEAVHNGGSHLVQVDPQTTQPFEDPLGFLQKLPLRPGDTFCLFRMEGASKTMGPVASNLVSLPLFSDFAVSVTSGSLQRETLSQATLEQETSLSAVSGQTEIKQPISSLFSRELLLYLQEVTRQIPLDLKLLLDIAQKMGLDPEMPGQDLILALVAKGLFTQEQAQSLFTLLTSHGLALNLKGTSLFQQAASLGIYAMVTIKNISVVFSQYGISFDLIEAQLRQALEELGLEVTQTETGMLTLATSQRLEAEKRERSLEKTVVAQEVQTTLESAESALTLTKQANVQKVFKGGKVIYTLTVRKNIPVRLTDLLIVDVLPLNLIVNLPSLRKNFPAMIQGQDAAGHPLVIWRLDKKALARYAVPELSCRFEVQIFP